MNTHSSAKASNVAVYSRQNASSPTESSETPTRSGFPEQEVHPDVEKGLWAEATRLSRQAKWRFLLQFDQYEEFAVNAIGFTLLELEGETEPKRCLSPRSSFERRRLIEQASPILHRWWNLLGRRAYSRYYRERDRIAFSQDAFERDEPILSTDHFHSVYRAESPALFEASVIDALLRKLCDHHNIEEGRAVLLIREWTSGEKQTEVYEAVCRMGYDFPSFGAMKRWLARMKKELSPAIQDFVAELLGSPPGDRALRNTGPSKEGPDIFYLLDFLSRVSFSPRSSILMIVPLADYPAAAI